VRYSANGAHVNFGPGPVPTPAAFIEAVERVLGRLPANPGEATVQFNIDNASGREQRSERSLSQWRRRDEDFTKC